jgi:RimJ/RimL family protein N-acetyltransferase
VAGRLHLWLRPDMRASVFFEDGDIEVRASLLDAALPTLDREVLADVDEDAADMRALLAGRGFAVSRLEHRYLVPVETALAALAGSLLPAEFRLISAAGADIDMHRALDDLLRHDIPGSAHWHSDPADFHSMIFEDPQFDPATYLIAVTGSGTFAGLVRIWNAPDVPRLGMIGVLREHRRTGLASAMLGTVLSVVAARGAAGVSCEVDEANAASNALMTKLGARRTGGTVEFALQARQR